MIVYLVIICLVVDIYQNIFKMEGPNGPSVYKQILSSSVNIHANSSTILPIAESHQILSKIHTNGDVSVASDKIYDEIDELKYEIKTRAASEVLVTDTKSTKSRRSSLLSKFLNFHRSPPRSIPTQNHHQTLDNPREKDSNSSLPPKTMDIAMDDDDSFFLRDDRRLDGQFSARPYNWPHDASLDKSTTALVIIDMQKDCKSHVIFFPDFWLHEVYISVSEAPCIHLILLIYIDCQ